MNDHLDNESWILEAADVVMEKKAGGAEISSVERLIYCLWVADYGMCNAGDLETASDLYSPFQSEGAELAAELGLPFTHQSFGLSTEAFEAEYFDRFNQICAEIRGILS